MMLPVREFKAQSFGVRHLQACWLFAGMIFGYFLRVNMSIAVVAMGNAHHANPDIAPFALDSSARSLMLSSFFWGYVVAQFPAAIGAQRFGAKRVLTLSTVVCSLLTAIVPWTFSLSGWKAVCILRVLIGFFQGTLYPCVHNLLSKWVPRTERGILSSIIYSGALLGTAAMLAGSGPIVTSYMGWPSLFYMSAGVAFIWAVAYFILGTESPDESVAISSAEREYINRLTGKNVNTSPATPWKDIFRSKPFIALLFAHCGYSWGFYTLLTEIPTYLDGVLGMNMDANGLLSALPYFVMWILCLVVSPIADYLINCKYLSTVTCRKLFNSIGQWVPMITLIALGYMTKDNVEWAIFLLTLAVGVNSASYVGYLVNHMDLSPNFAGIMMGITNGFATLMSICAPLVAGAVVENEHDAGEWRIVFFITSAFYFVSNLVFVLFGSADIQQWNNYEVEPANLGEAHPGK